MESSKLSYEPELPFNWTNYQRARLWTGFESVCLLVRENPEIAELLKSQGLDYVPPDNVKQVSLILERDTIAKLINSVERVDGVCFYDKIAVLDWADRIGLTIPSDVRAYIEIERKKTKPIKPLDSYLIDPALGLDVKLEHFTLIELWRFDENRNLLIPTDSYGDSGLEKILIKAVRDGELNAIVHKSERPWEKEKGNGTGYIKVDKCDFNDISNTGWLGGSYVRLTIHRDDFKGWLKKTKRQLPDGCLLHLWLEGHDTQSKAMEIDGEDSQDKSELIASRTIPARLLPDANYQFLIGATTGRFTWNASTA